MRDTFKVYEIALLPHENFTFYRCDGKLVNSNSLERPYPVQPSHIWSASAGGFTSYTPPGHNWIDIVRLPVVGVIPNELQRYIVCQGVEIAKVIAEDEDSQPNRELVVATQEVNYPFLKEGASCLNDPLY